MYEAAKVDGIGAYDRFRHLTLPNLRSALVPLVAARIHLDVQHVQRHLPDDRWWTKPRL